MTESALATPVGKGPSLGRCLAFIILVLTVLVVVNSGCAYKGGKIVDGTNFALGITIPGTEWTMNLADYVGGLRVAGNNQTRISVTNEVAETNRYFGVVETSRRTKMSATIEPCEDIKQDKEETDGVQ